MKKFLIAAMTITSITSSFLFGLSYLTSGANYIKNAASNLSSLKDKASSLKGTLSSVNDKLSDLGSVKDKLQDQLSAINNKIRDTADENRERIQAQVRAQVQNIKDTYNQKVLGGRTVGQ